MTYEISESVVWTGAGNEVRLYDTDSGEFRTLNDSAAQIWHLITDGACEQQVSDVLVEKYSAGDADEGAVIARDVHRFLATLVEGAILVRTDTAGDDC
ncbi:PqqD family protein [Kitasatospora viridis]|uniref:Coenzyme PQQ synthesis protein D (PqqD) n=1 Tax=Kitasatospora viridis TaxID=281105 RepID=A0A561UPY8_9ACTN|nr:PqqD family protein [Kitasatospora viridis]TWG01433.1 coenzyme PQQ synthesis protein D (PqqD) [Kitasatospora viridis]